VLDGFTQQLAAMKIKSGTETSYKRNASDFSAQVARMKVDGCDLVVLGTVVRETIGAMTEARKIGWNGRLSRCRTNERDRGPSAW
jgi:branched-chain amino acid transport system substrate-binding protein